MDREPELTELIDPSEYTFFDSILHYSLFVGAIFQLFCIFAVVFYTPSENVRNYSNYLKRKKIIQINNNFLGRISEWNRGK